MHIAVYVEPTKEFAHIGIMTICVARIVAPWERWKSSSLAVFRMIRYENQCVDCGFPCRYEACRYYKVEIPVCGECGEDADKLYRLDGEELCETCVLERLEVVE